MDLQRRIAAREGDFLLFALTPPRASTSAQEAQETADITVERLRRLKIDGLILYDIEDEPDRTGQERPCPFLPTRPTFSPWVSENETSSKRTCGPYCLQRPFTLSMMSVPNVLVLLKLNLLFYRRKGSVSKTFMKRNKKRGFWPRSR